MPSSPLFNTAPWLAKTANYEGFKPKVYKDSRGIKTIGYGTNLEDPAIQNYLKSKGYSVSSLLSGKHTISEKEASTFLKDKFEEALSIATKTIPNFENLPESVKYVTTDMLYNLGQTRFNKFKKLKEAIQRGDFPTAAEELKNSNYYNQVGNRAKAHYETLKSVKTPTDLSKPQLNIPMYNEEGTFLWSDKTSPATLEKSLFGAVGPTVKKAAAMQQVQGIQPKKYAQGGLIKRADGSYSPRGLWDNIRANKGSGRKPTAEMLRQEAKIRAEEYEQGGPVYNWIPPIYPRVGARYEDGSWVMNSSIPTPTTPSYYPDYPDRTLTNYQMGTPKAPMYGGGGGVNTLEGDMIANVLMNRNRDKDFVQRAYAVGDYPNSPMFNLFSPEEFGSKMSHRMAWGEDDNGQTYMFPTIMNSKNEAIKVPNQYADYISSEGYKNATGIPMYNAGSTVWTKQTTPTWVAGTPTPTATQNFRNDRSLNTDRYRIGDVIPTGMDYKSPAAGTYDYNKDVQPYYKMRLHAPDTRRMAYGGYVPMYGFGSFITDVGKLALNTLAAPLEQVTGNNFVNFNYANKGMADAAAVSEGVLGAATDIVGTTFAGPVYGMAKGQVQGITKGLGTSTEEQRGANKWANKTGQIAGSTGNVIAGIASGNPQQIVGGAGELLGTTGGQFGSKELGMVGQLAGLSSSFINPGTSTNSFGKVPQLGGTGDVVSGSGMLMARNGGRVTNDYKKRVGIPYAINPGISDAGMYVGPTTQRGITFGNGGIVSLNKYKQGGWLDNL